MRVECECGREYRYDESHFKDEAERRVDCPKCGKTIVINNPKLHTTEAHDILLRTNVKELQHPSFTLSILKGVSGGKVIQLRQGTTSIGRAGAHVVIDDREASRIHAEIHVDGDKLILRDLNSSNGTYVDGKKITELEVTDDCEFRVGQTTLAIHKVLLRFD